MSQLFFELMPSGLAPPADQDEMRMQIAKQMSNEGILNLSEYNGARALPRSQPAPLSTRAHVPD